MKGCSIEGCLGDHLLPGFDRWLASVKAEAWEQGRRAEEKAWIHVFDGHPVEEGDMCDQCSTDNPYREETNDE